MGKVIDFALTTPFLGLMKTCAKLEIRFWDYLGCRLGAPGAPHVAPLPQLIRQAALT